jgi:hypothetical protein
MKTAFVGKLIFAGVVTAGVGITVITAGFVAPATTNRPASQSAVSDAEKRLVTTWLDGYLERLRESPSDSGFRVEHWERFVSKQGTPTVKADVFYTSTLGSQTHRSMVFYLANNRVSEAYDVP